MSREPEPEPEPDQKTARGAARARYWAPLGVVGACALLLTGSFALNQRATGRVVAGVYVAQLEVSRLTAAEVRARLDAWAEQRKGAPLTFTLDGSSLTFEPKSAGFQIDAQGVTEQALAAGRQGALPARFAGFIARWFRPEVVPLAIRFDSAELASVEDDWQARVVKAPPFAGGVSVDGTRLTPLYPHAGTVLDRAAIATELESAITSGRGGVALTTRVETPKTDHAEVDRVVALAESMLTSGVELSTADGSRRLSLSATDIASVLQVKPDAERAKLDLACALDATLRLLEPRRGTLEQQPENAKFVIDAQDHVHVEPGHGALVLDDAAVANAICTAAQSPTKKAELPLRAGAEPALTTEAAEHLGVVALMGTYTTRHVCCQPRVQNIHHIADLLDGTLVKPGDTFSVNQAVGQRSVKNGFRPAPSIEDGDMVDTVGGGVSQFATTLFNALFYGGYDILERQPHTYWFTRYPMGYDATLSFPHPDIIFKNDTAAGALIKTSYTDTTITVKIYGDNGGRKVRAEVSARQNIVLPPVEYIPNPHLDADEEKTREGGEIGWSVIVKRTLTFPDGKIKEERRKVTYKPRARRVEVHPCKIPEGEPGHTGERCPKPDPDKVDKPDNLDGSGATDTGAK
jgi:vancomycin resistance protein YoaR